MLLGIDELKSHEIKNFSIANLSPEILLKVIDGYIKGQPPLNPETMFANAAFQKAWQVRAEFENKKRPLSTRIVIGPQITKDTIARQDFKKIHEKAYDLVNSSIKFDRKITKEEALLIAVEEFRPKEPKIIKTEFDFDSAVAEKHFLRAAQILRDLKVLEKTHEGVGLFFEQSSSKVHKIVAEMLKARDSDSFTQIAVAFDEILAGDNHLDVNKLMRFEVTQDMLNNVEFWNGIEKSLVDQIRQDSQGSIFFATKDWNSITATNIAPKSKINSLPVVSAVVSKNISALLTADNLPVAEQRIVLYEVMGFDRTQILTQAKALNTAATQIARFLSQDVRGENSNAKQYLESFKKMGVDPKQILTQAKAIDIAAAQIWGLFSRDNLLVAKQYLAAYKNLNIRVKDIEKKLKEDHPKVKFHTLF